MIYALVTVYNPVSKISNNIQIISEQVDSVYICDNSKNINQQLFEKFNNVKYIFNNQNLGISSAFNKILKTENFNNDDFIIFFDQDSLISKNHVSSLIEEYKKIEKNENIGCLGPVYLNTNTNLIEIPKAIEKLNENVIKVRTIITSSMLCKYSTLKEIGFWDETIFLDYADWGICWKMQTLGFQCYVTENVLLNHSLGDGSKKVLFFTILNEKPYRLYYQTRDGLLLLSKKYIPLAFKVKLFSKIYLNPLFSIILFSDKKNQIKFFRKGLKDYKKGIKGALGD